MMRSVWLALSLFVAATSAIAGDLSAAREKELRNLLIQDCGSCHGLTMKGGLGPALLPAQLKGKSAEYLSSVILYGRPGSAMPPWKGILTASEARWMADRLLSQDLR